MRNYLGCLVGLLVLLLGCNAINKNPTPPPATEAKPKYSFSVGQWTSYRIRRSAKDSPETYPRNLSEATMKISIVDKQSLKDKVYYWVEYLINEGTEQQRVVKFMVDDEGNFQPVKLIMKHGKLEPVEIELRRWETRTRLTADILFHEMTSKFNIIPFTKQSNSGKTEDDLIQINTGGKETNLKCQKVVMGESDGGLHGTAWYAPLIPLAGLVKAFFVEGDYLISITLIDYGTNGGKSVITEEPKRLDLQE